jgi:hypothetical protein
MARKSKAFSELRHLQKTKPQVPSQSNIDFKVGDSIVVKQGVLDPDFGTDLSGWQGRISEIDRQNNLVSIDWDSVTLKNIPDAVIDECEEDNLNWARMYLEPTEVELTQPQDTEEDVAAIIEQIESQHRWSYLGEEGKGIQAVLAEVDPDDEMAALVAWEEHLQKVLSFPFEAVVDEFQERGPLRAGDKVTVQSIVHVEGLYGILVKLKSKRRRYDFPLCDLEATEPNSSNYRFLREYVVWFANR